ncbi:MAG: hypothetical protein KAJ18_01600 [Candidatus Omnitrophica bacterium]|nr:hypothetical protein [Candidatus Omnitrophota bacterium]
MPIFEDIIASIKILLKGKKSFSKKRKSSSKRKRVTLKTKKKVVKKKQIKKPVKKVVPRKKSVTSRPKNSLKKPPVKAKKKLKQKTTVLASIKEAAQGPLVGEITHYFSKIMVCVVKVEKKPVKVGDTVRIQGSTTRFTQKIQSLQVESQDVRIARKGQLVGLKVNKAVRAGDKVYLVV